MSAMDSPGGGLGRRGPLVVGAVVVAVLLGALGLTLWLTRSGEQRPSAADNPGAAPNSNPPAATASASAAPADCGQTTAEFKTFAGPRPGMSGAILDRVTSVCWQPTGELRAEASYPADVNATFQEVVTLCRVLSDFVSGSGRPWRGFTVYSTHRLTPGWEFLTAANPGGPCTNPQHTR